MSSTAWAGGQGAPDFGPCSIYWDTATGGENVRIYGLSVSLKTTIKKVDLFEMHKGDVPANRGVSGTQMTLEMEVTRADLETMQLLVQGFRLNPTTGGSYNGYSQGDALGELDSDILKQVTLVKIKGQGESLSPKERFQIWKVAPTADFDMKFDASSQRTVKLMFQCYSDDTKLDGAGRPTFYGQGVI